MTDEFSDQLTEIEQRIGAAISRAVAELTNVAGAVVNPAAETASLVGAAAHALRRGSRLADAELLTLAAEHTPVADDLRLVLVLIQLAHHQGLIANQFELISDQLADIDPGVLDELHTGERLAQMATLAAAQLKHAMVVFTARDADRARDVEHEDDQIDAINRDVFRATLDLDGHRSQRELAYRHVLIARSLERIGDNAVDIAEQAAFFTTAQMREFTDASHPHKRLLP